MTKIDIDKFVASIMKCLCMPHREDAYMCRHWINKALDAQGLKFENGEIVKNQRRIAAEAKEAIFDDEDERIRKRIIHALHGDVLDMEETNKAIAWIEKQEGCKQKNKINSYKITFEDVLALECAMKTVKITEGGDKLYEILVPLYNKIHNAYLAEKQEEEKPSWSEEDEEEKSKWKDAQGDDLPQIDKVVAVLCQPYPLEDGEYSISFAHRPNPDGWDGKNLSTGKIKHYTPEIYGKGGWNIPDVIWWLDIEFPKMEEEK